MKDKLFTVAYMAAVSAAFTLSVALVDSATQKRRDLNAELAKKRVIMEVLGVEVPKGAKLEKTLNIYEERVYKTDIRVNTGAGEVPVLAARSANDELMGYCFQVAGKGFWDMLWGYMAVSPDLKRIRGLAFYEQSETPGLGAEITKPWFEQQFEGKEIPSEPGQDGKLFRLVQPGGQKKEHDVDGVTGATNTTDAVERILNNTLMDFMQTMRKRNSANGAGGE